MMKNPFAHVQGLERINLTTLDPSDKMRLLNTDFPTELTKHPLSSRPDTGTALPDLADLLVQLTNGPAPEYVCQLFPKPFSEYVRIFPRIHVVNHKELHISRWDQLIQDAEAELSPATSTVNQLLKAVNNAFRARNQNASVGYSSQGGFQGLCIGTLDPLTTAALSYVLQQVHPHPRQTYFVFRGNSALGPDSLLAYRGVAALFAQLYLDQSSSLETPTMWWAEDWSWCLTIAQDAPTAYLGGSPEVIHAVLSYSSIEAYKVAHADLADDITNDWFNMEDI